MTTEYSEGDLLEVRFEDIKQHAGWISLKEARIERPPKCKTIGWFLSEDTKVIRLVTMAGIDEDGEEEVTTTVIPKSIISHTSKVRDDELFDFGSEGNE